MKFKNLYKESVNPELYSPGTSVMWTDKYISKQLLAVHLNPEIDAASRNPHDINLTINWILSQCESHEMNILDLGCGPGLYTEEFARKGHNVTGIDFSKNSVSYAIEQSKIKKQNITYLNQNYLDLDFKYEFDLIVMIYTDFGALIPSERYHLLKKIFKALKKGGIFIFDVVNDKNIPSKISPKSWEIQNKGFWKPSPYITFSESFHYPDKKIILNQHIVLDKTDNFEIYRFWIHYFNADEIFSMLSEFGFQNKQEFTNIISSGNQWKGENINFYKAIKP